MATKKGYIKIYRALQENVLWKDKPFSKGQAWVDILLSANHADNQILLGNKPTLIKRGQFHTSELQLAEKWGWSRRKVRAYLLLLERLEMGTSKGTTQGTTLTVENYEQYQVSGTAKDTTEDTAEEHQKHNERYTNKNDKGMKKNDKEIYRDFSSDNEELFTALSEWEKMRRLIKSPLSDKAKELSLTALKKLSLNPKEQIKIINQSTLHSWKSFYELKEDLAEKKPIAYKNEVEAPPPPPRTKEEELEQEKAKQEVMKKLGKMFK